MTTMARVKMRWQGLPGGNGYSIFHFRDFTVTGDVTQPVIDGSVAKVQAFANSIKGLVAHTVTLQVENDVEIIEDTNGNLVDLVPTTTQAPLASTATTAAYSALAGAVITWRTAGIVRNRRVRGRTFLVPLAGNTFQTDGTLGPTTISTLQTAANALINTTGDGDLGVWSRPSFKGASDGVWFLARSATIPDMSSVLKSRRS